MASLVCNPTTLTFMRIFGVFEEATNLVNVGLVGEEDNKWILGHFCAIKVRRQEELRAHRQPGGRTVHVGQWTWDWIPPGGEF